MEDVVLATAGLVCQWVDLVEVALRDLGREGDGAGDGGEEKSG